MVNEPGLACSFLFWAFPFDIDRVHRQASLAYSPRAPRWSKIHLLNLPRLHLPSGHLWQHSLLLLILHRCLLRHHLPLHLIPLTLMRAALATSGCT
jgi:hypothetical protein